MYRSQLSSWLAQTLALTLTVTLNPSAISILQITFHNSTNYQHLSRVYILSLKNSKISKYFMELLQTWSQDRCISKRKLMYHRCRKTKMVKPYSLHLMPTLNLTITLNTGPDHKPKCRQVFFYWSLLLCWPTKIVRLYSCVG